MRRKRFLSPVLALLFVGLAITTGLGQVPKPPWASGGSGTQKSPASPGRADTAPAGDSNSTIKVDVKQVNVFVTVTDEHGAPVARLNKADFQLREDGKEQKIAVFEKKPPLPLSVVLDIDPSLSPRRDFPLELASARRF